MTRRSPLLAALAAVVLVLAACDPDSPKPPNYSSVSPTPSASTSASPTASASPSVPTTGPNVSPGETPPTEPAAASTNDSAGALAFVGYYIRMSDWVFATSDTSILDPFFATSCATCRSAQENLASYVENGSHFTGGRIALNQIQVVQNDGRQSADFAITSVTDVGAASVVSAAGAVERTFPASTGFQLTDWIRWVDGRWQIVEERKV